ncbi:MAG: Imidazoleglycerol phosphate dehydratase HisB [Candidatus Alkanophagales archaeon MCA70_species_2]|nr:Imidazoleglycerol phosphate dehydratase HisB [Candidatus Alkanophaga liquidiphilum]
MEAKIKRKTSETDVEVSLRLRGTGEASVRTSVRFFDHMLETLAKHGRFDLEAKAEGDFEHHVVEDVGIVLGEAFNKALGGKERRENMRRFGFAAVPMDDALAFCAVDIVGRSFLAFAASFKSEKIEDLSVENVEHFLRSFVTHARITVHIRAEGKNDHHTVEAVFKALALALREAVSAHPSP